MKRLPGIVLTGLCLAACDRGRPPQDDRPPDPIAVLAKRGAALGEVPFADVIRATTGKAVIPVTPESPVDGAFLAVVGAALDEVTEAMGAADSPVRGLRRINEASRFFEDGLAEAIDAHPDFTCRYPETPAGKVQRAGYPDLVITHRESGRVAYLDPKLFETGNRDSSLRTFYYEPKPTTSKVLHDAHHLLAGIEHDGNDGAWRFTAWHLVDLSGSNVRLKVEFQASNRDLYRDELILASGGTATPAGRADP